MMSRQISGDCILPVPGLTHGDTECHTTFTGATIGNRPSHSINPDPSHRLKAQDPQPLRLDICCYESQDASLGTSNTLCSDKQDDRAKFIAHGLIVEICNFLVEQGQCAAMVTIHCTVGLMLYQAVTLNRRRATR